MIPNPKKIYQAILLGHDDQVLHEFPVDLSNRYSTRIESIKPERIKYTPYEPLDPISFHRPTYLIWDVDWIETELWQMVTCRFDILIYRRIE